MSAEPLPLPMCLELARIQGPLSTAQVVALLRASVRLAAQERRTLRLPMLRLTLDGTLALDVDAPGAGRLPRSYVAPEMREGRASTKNPALQAYAAGALLFEIATGRPPLDPRLRTSDELTQEIVLLLRRALAPSRADRFATVEALLAATLALEAVPSDAEEGRILATLAQSSLSRASGEPPAHAAPSEDPPELELIHPALESVSLDLAAAEAPSSDTSSRLDSLRPFALAPPGSDDEPGVPPAPARADERPREPHAAELFARQAMDLFGGPLGEDVPPEPVAKIARLALRRPDAAEPSAAHAGAFADNGQPSEAGAPAPAMFAVAPPNGTAAQSARLATAMEPPQERPRASAQIATAIEATLTGQTPGDPVVAPLDAPESGLAAKASGRAVIGGNGVRGLSAGAASRGRGREERRNGAARAAASPGVEPAAPRETPAARADAPSSSASGDAAGRPAQTPAMDAAAPTALQRDAAAAANPLQEPAAQIAQVESLLAARRLHEAQALAEQVAAAAPASAAAQVALGNVLLSRGDAAADAPRAQAMLARAVELDARWGRAHALLGLALLAQGKRRAARAALQAALAADPANLEASLALVRLRSRLIPSAATVAASVAISGAFALWLESRRPDPTPPPPQIIVQQVPPPAASPLPPAPAPQKAEPPAAPVKTAARAAEAPKKKRATSAQLAAAEQVAKGEEALRTGDIAQAVALFRDAARAAPELAVAHRGLARALVMEGDDEGARKEFRRYLELDPRAPDADRVRRVLEQQ